MENNFYKLRRAISVKLGIPEEQIKPESFLQGDLNADPINLADLLTSLEEEFKIKVPEEEIPNFKTVQNILDFVNDHSLL